MAASNEGPELTTENVHIRPHSLFGYNVTYTPRTQNKEPLTRWVRTEDEARTMKAELIKTQGKLPKKELKGD